MSIELKDISKKFGDTTAVDHVSFSVKDGELVALLGPSGCGKTTVLRMISGLERPTEGDIFIRSRRVNDHPVQHRNIGFVFQSYALFQMMTVFDNIAFGLKVKKVARPEREARVDELLGLLELRGLGKRLPHQLSGGQRQRVAIARALAPRPNVLLLDEPFAAVDARIRQDLREWLVRLHDELKLTTLFVTHDQEEAMEVSDRIVIFSKGQIEQVGAPREVYEQPSNEFVARFIGVLNVLDLQVAEGKARLNELEFPTHGLGDGQRLRIGFRPYAVRISSNTSAYQYRAVVRHTYFLGVMLRVELELPSGLVIRARMSKEDYELNQLEEGSPVSFQIRQYRILGSDDDALEPEVATIHEAAGMMGEGI